MRNGIETFGERNYLGQAKKQSPPGELRRLFPLMPRGWASWRAAGFLKLEHFWNRGLYVGRSKELDEDASTKPGAQLSLAEFNNGNFLGEDAIYFESLKPTDVVHRFPFPSRNTSTTWLIVAHALLYGLDTTTFSDGFIGNRVYLRKITDGVPITHHSVLPYEDVVRLSSAPTFTRTLGIPYVPNDVVLWDYHNKLIPKGIEYSAGVIDYFFRGKLSVGAYHTNINDFVYLNVTNQSGQTMSGGTLELYADATDGTRTKVTTLQPSWWPTNSLGDQAWRQFIFCEPCPAPTTYMLVYRGTIGVDNTGKALDPVDDQIAIAAASFPPPPRDSAGFLAYANTTQVPDYANPSGTIAPYSRPNGTLVISCSSPDQCGALGSGLPECGVPNPIPQNTYAPKTPAEYVYADPPPHAGFKNVFAWKAWHGHWGFNSQEWRAPDSLSGTQCQCMDSFLKAAPDLTKFLKLDVNSAYSWQAIDLQTGASGGSGSGNCSRSVSVDRLSGKITLGGCSDSDSGGEDGYDAAVAANDNLGVSDSTIYTMVGKYCGAQWPVAVDISETGSGGHLQLTATGKDDSRTHGVLDLDIAGGTFIRQDYDWKFTYDQGFHGTWGVVKTETLSLTGTSLHWSRITYDYGLPGLNTITETVDATLSQPYTNDQLNADVDELLSYWDLENNAQYPWRTDVNVTNGPAVVRDEKPPTAPAVVYNCTVNVGTSQNPVWVPWTDNTPCTGAVIGAPNPPGYEPYFDFTHQNYRNCIDENGRRLWYIQSYGSYAPSYAPYATKWLNEFEATAMPQGAFSAYNALIFVDSGIPFAAGSMVKCKYAEVILPTPAHNYSRPGGRDRYVYDKPTVHCVTGINANVVSIDAPETHIASGDICMLINSGNDGVYSVTKLSDTTYNLASRICFLPEGVSSDSPFFGKLRWPTVPALRGQVTILSAMGSPGQLVTVTVSDAGYLREGDQIVIGGTGFSELDGTWTLTSIIGNNLTLDRSVTSGVLATQGWVRSPGGWDPVWDSNQSRGDWCLATWRFNFRDVGENTRLHNAFVARQGQPTCAALTDVAPLRPNTGGLAYLDQVQETNLAAFCCRAFVIISPNNERSSLGTGPGMPSLDCDEDYGSLWQCAPVQWMQDPLWQPPPRPCGMEPQDRWVEDDGSGQQDTWGVDPGSDEPYEIRFYPQRPWEECRIAVPPLPAPGAPPMPAGTYLGSLTVDQLNLPTVPPGNVWFPPNPGSCYSAPWITFELEQANITAQGRFSCEYAKPESLCPDDFVEDAP